MEICFLHLLNMFMFCAFELLCRCIACVYSLCILDCGAVLCRTVETECMDMIGCHEREECLYVYVCA